MNIDTHQRKKVILLQSYYPGDKIEKSPILFNQPEPQGKASEERNRSLGKLLNGVRNSNSYWDLLTNSVHMIVDLKSADVEKQTQEVPIEAKEVKKSNTLKNKDNKPQERKKQKMQTVVIQKQFKARYLKIRLFDRSNNSQFLTDTFKEVWT